jgi:radical SAM superfamily enzyme YgiQ (UPF0313 family)
VKVLLVLPALDPAPEPYRERRGVKAARSAIHRATGVAFGGGNRLPPFGLMQLAALTPPDVEVEIVDEWVQPVDLETDADLVGLSLMTAAAPRGYELARAFRDRGIPVVLGGIHATVCPEEAAEHADAVVVAEAEDVWEGLLADAGNGGLRQFYQADSFCDMKGLPAPRRDIVSSNGYISLNVVQTTRGCPHQCSFCSIHLAVGKRFRSRPVDEVVEEIAALPDRLVLFVDDNFCGNPAYTKELLEALIPLGITFTAQADLRMTRDDELLDLAKRAGCRFLLIGFESVSEEAIAAMGKGSVNAVSDYKRAIERLHAHGIGAVGSFIVGFDEDDRGVFERTARCIDECGVDAPLLSFLTPYPGSAVHDEFSRDGRLLSEDWRDYAHMYGGVVFEPKQMTAAELEDGYREMGRMVYRMPAIARRALGSGRNAVPAALYSMGRRFAFF